MNGPTYRRAAEAEAAHVLSEKRQPLPVEMLASEDDRREDIEELLTEIREPLEISIKPERLHPRKS